jgi:hypothetical protein
MPCFSGMGMVTIQVINDMGIRFPEVHTSAENLARSAVLTAEMFGFDAAIVPYDMCTVPDRRPWAAVPAYTNIRMTFFILPYQVSGQHLMM